MGKLMGLKGWGVRKEDVVDAGRRVAKVRVALSGMGKILGLPEGTKVVGAEITREGLLDLQVEEGTLPVVKLGERVRTYNPAMDEVEGKTVRFKSWGEPWE